MAEATGLLAAVGIVSSILSVVEFCCSVGKHTVRLLSASEDVLRENIEVERVTRDYELVSGNVKSSQPDAETCIGGEEACRKLAEECSVQARKLLTMLDELRVQTHLTGPKKLLHSAHKVAKALRLRKDVEKKQKQLERMNGLLAKSLIQLLKTTEEAPVQDLLAAIHNASKDVREGIASTVTDFKTEILQEMQKGAANIQLRGKAEICDLSERTRTLEQSFRDHGDSSRTANITASITDSLRFPEMRARRDAIQWAHERTFAWILSDSGSIFRQWIDSGNGFFWVAGKAGSGKSTLMKYLAQRLSTGKGFLHTNSDRSVYVLEHFFWYLGTPLQKSTEGLLRSVLYQMLDHCPDLVSIACERRFTAPLSFHENPDVWTYAELLQTLGVIAEKVDLPANFYISVDGLDEYAGDHQDLIEMLLQLANNPCFRICASSRPWNVFENAFSDGNFWLRLEDLTEDDIKDKDRLRGLPNTPDLQTLVGELVTKAQGVLLWVYLVVSTLRRGLVEGDGILTMCRRLQALPSDLESFFDLILARVDGVYSPQTAQCLRLAVSQVDENENPSLIHSFPAFG